jgi:predicted SprT family Zn-dependent metalloprotease
MPNVAWFEYIDWGKTAGETYENGNIHLVHPENWKRGRKYNSERGWINMVYHELAHYFFWADAETKADTFAVRMVRGLNGNGKTNHNK